jgi:hypothetical protein
MMAHPLAQRCGKGVRRLPWASAFGALRLLVELSKADG